MKKIYPDPPDHKRDVVAWSIEMFEQHIGVLSADYNNIEQERGKILQREIKLKKSGEKLTEKDEKQWAHLTRLRNIVKGEINSLYTYLDMMKTRYKKEQDANPRSKPGWANNNPEVKP